MVAGAIAVAVPTHDRYRTSANERYSIVPKLCNVISMHLYRANTSELGTKGGLTDEVNLLAH